MLLAPQIPNFDMQNLLSIAFLLVILFVGSALFYVKALKSAIESKQSRGYRIFYMIVMTTILIASSFVFLWGYFFIMT